jgi:hypothetical protein
MTQARHEYSARRGQESYDAICFELQLKTFLEGKRKYNADPEVEANAPLDTGLE